MKKTSENLSDIARISGELSFSRVMTPQRPRVVHQSRKLSLHLIFVYTDIKVAVLKETRLIIEGLGTPVINCSHQIVSAKRDTLKFLAAGFQ